MQFAGVRLRGGSEAGFGVDNSTTTIIRWKLEITSYHKNFQKDPVVFHKEPVHNIS